MGDMLATLVEETQYELLQVASPAAGQNFREHIKARIRREYRRLYHDYDWPHLIDWTDLLTQAGERYYDWPADAALDTTIEVWRQWGGTWSPVDRGIDPEHYNAFDSDDDTRSDPVLRWRPKGSAQIELWPVPSTDDLKLRFVVKTPFTPLVEEDDRCDLDTDLVVLHAAAQLARRHSSEDAAIILARAQQHYNTLKSRLIRKGNKVNFASGAPEAWRPGFSEKQRVGVRSGS